MRARYRHPWRGSPLCFSQHSGSVVPNRSDFRNAQRNSFTDGNNSIISAHASGTLIRVRRIWQGNKYNLFKTSNLTCNVRYLKNAFYGGVETLCWTQAADRNSWTSSPSSTGGTVGAFLRRHGHRVD